MVTEVVIVLRRMLSGRSTGPVFVRPRFVSTAASESTLVKNVQVRAASTTGEDSLSREALAGICRRVWREAGAVKADAIRKSFIRGTRAVGLDGATCPKTWRHTFATLLQDANVDPLVRQITLGHQPLGSTVGLGMTSMYTHTRPETQRREIERAIRLWPESLALARAWAGEDK